MAIGARDNDGNGSDAGHVRIYENQFGTWTQIGNDIDGEAENDESGYSVSLSSDGSVVAIGAPRNDVYGHVRIYENQSGTWIQIGNDIDGEAVSDGSGEAVSLNSDGSVVAIGADGNDGNGTSAGHVRIYENQSGTWTQIGNDIDGESSYDYSGKSVSLSSDGSVVAIGANRNDGNGFDVGHVRIYENQSGTWTQIGNDIDGEATDDNSGGSVSLSSNGLIVAIGAILNNGNGSNSGHVRIYEYLYPPIITNQPINQTNICVGDGVVFSVEAENADTYTWAVRINGGVPWTDLSDNTTYFGSATYSLTITTNFSLNNYQYSCTVSNALGYENSDVTTLTFETENPEITSTHYDQTVNADANCETSLANYTEDVTTTDNCDNNLDITQTPTAGTTISGVTNEITLTVTDDAGNIGEVTFNVEVVDNTDPVITSTHNDQTVDADENCQATLLSYISTVTATDNCDADLTVTQSPTAGTMISGTTNEITLTVTDDMGNYTQTAFYVEVIDNTDPEITTTHNDQTADADANCETSLLDYTGDVIATDNCDDNLDITQTPSSGTTISGTTNEITLTVTDDAGNTVEITFNVEVIDNTDPEITSTHNDQTINANENCQAILPDYTSEVIATDNCDDNLDISQSPTVGSTIYGTTNVITLTVTDDANNTEELTFNVEVVDNTNPEITCVDNQIVIADDETNTYTIQGIEFDPIATNDNCNFEISNNYNSLPTLAGAVVPLGTTIITWTITDNANNFSNCMFTVLVNEFVNIKTLQQNGISIYPNPTNGILNFEFANNNVQQIKISDLTGKVIIEKNNIQQNEMIDLSSFESGIYIIKIQTNNEISTTKIIKD